MKERRDSELTYEQMDLREITSLSLALQFNPEEKIVFEYYIPDGHIISSSAVHALKTLCGVEQNFNYFDDNVIHLSGLGNTKRLQSRTIEGLLMTINPNRRGASPFLEEYLSYKSLFGTEWFCMLGNVYRFREGVREKAEEAVKKYWVQVEIEDFDSIGILMRDFAKNKFAERDRSYHIRVLRKTFCFLPLRERIKLLDKQLKGGK